jgi:phosphoribosyl 1,2-cyclic phosphodiesterase
MTGRFAMLASGSSGNACWLEANGFGVLVDIGLGPRQLASRLSAAGATWNNVHAVLLTHTHTDHWKERTLQHLRQKKIPLYCHAEHDASLRSCSPAFAKLQEAGLVHTYERDRPWKMSDRLACRALELRHDSMPTFGFRLEAVDGLFGTAWSVGYVADLGCWSPELAAELADVDVLALEFNHDEIMELNSGRSTALIDRVLGDYGHLSNSQAAALFHAILARSRPRGVCHLVQLHLSRECNRPKLAQIAARSVLERMSLTLPVHTAAQDKAGPVLNLHANDQTRRKALMAVSRPLSILPATAQCLPGME